MEPEQSAHLFIGYQKTAMEHGGYPILSAHPLLDEIGVLGWGPLRRTPQLLVVLLAPQIFQERRHFRASNEFESNRIGEYEY